jgi:hypothetical protein
MQWFRNLFGNKAAPARPSVRPQLEALEERQLLNASVVFDAAGNKTTFIVYENANETDGTAYRIDKNGAVMIGQKVLNVHGYLDPKGQVGLDIVYANGQAFEFDSTGARTIGTSGILDASRAYDKNGNFKLDVLYNDGKGNGTGNLVEYTNTGFTQTANVVWATAYLDVNGALGAAVEYSVDGQGNVQAFAFDSTGVRTLFTTSDRFNTQNVNDYQQATDPNGRAIIDITTYGDQCFEYGPTTVTNLGGNVLEANPF